MNKVLCPLIMASAAMSLLSCSDVPKNTTCNTAATAAAAQAATTTAAVPDNHRKESTAVITNSLVKTSKIRKVIIDTDTGGDDATALIIAAKNDGIEILGVTVAAGNVNVDQAADNAIMTLEVIGKGNIPVFKGASTTYTGKERQVFSVYGKDGMGDKGLIHPKGKAQEQNAVDFILETVKNNPGEIEIIALGPLTNLALALDKDPETMNTVKRVWSMGTSGFGPGNATPVAEFNVYHDAEAYKVIADSQIPVTAIGLNTNTEDTYLLPEDLERLSKGTPAAAFVAGAMSGLLKFNKESRGQAVASVPDGIAVACALWPDYVLTEATCHASVRVSDDETYGQVILYDKSFTYDSGITFDNYNFIVIDETRSWTFKEKLFEILSK